MPSLWKCLFPGVAVVLGSLFWTGCVQSCEDAFTCDDDADCAHALCNPGRVPFCDRTSDQCQCRSAGTGGGSGECDHVASSALAMLTNRYTTRSFRWKDG
jgi:hypothetical protein